MHLTLHIYKHIYIIYLAARHPTTHPRRQSPSSERNVSGRSDVADFHVYKHMYIIYPAAHHPATRYAPEVTVICVLCVSVPSMYMYICLAARHPTTHVPIEKNRETAHRRGRRLSP